MFKQFRELAAHVRDTLPAITWIDRDKGQLKKPDSYNTIIIPGLLVKFDEVKWNPGTRGAQTGLTTLMVSLCFEVPPATHEGAFFDEYPEYEELVEDLHDCLSKHDGVGDRRSSFDYYTPEFYVCEMTYDFKIYHEVATKSIIKPKPEIKGEITSTLTIHT